ncbi:MAG: hypothetical protein J5449_06410 [Oscillospiraceae bacterium]|nr:hypothetical protein [Oscillospiraceae bacterium]
MNRLNKDFNVAERILLIILGILLVGVVYYYFVHLAVANNITSLKAEKESLEYELMGLETQARTLRKMQREMDEINGGKDKPRLESYNNSRSEIGLLNDILTAAREYTVTASSVTRNGDLIRRSFVINFTTDNYDTVEHIAERLNKSRCRCLIEDMSFSESKGIQETVQVSMVVTFYETMVGGEPDAGLPSDGDSKR